MKYQLEIQNITKSYGDLKANDDISLSIKPATIHALLGENGAGKSTLVKVIYGSLQADSGQMQWCGEGYSPKSPFEAREEGIAMVFQHFSLFDSLTVAENIILGLDDIGLDTDFTEQIIKYSKQYGLDINPQQVVGDLSVGARQRVEIIRCLMQNPKLLIMDEPTSVLTPQEVTDLFITNTNKIHHKLSKNDTLPVLFDDSSLYKESIRAIQTLKKHNISKDKPPLISVKNSLFSTPLSYMGFSGYINPFTLEAQINKNIPKIQVPTTICHEIAHQMGYSAENEANFIGIMAAIHSENNLVSYSGNTLALRHLLNELYKSDKKSHHLLISKVNKGILINFIEANKEWEKYNNPFEPYFKGLFDYFLKVNNQTEGVKSYNLVVNLLVNYYSN